MSEFEQWFKTTSAYRMLQSMNYYKMDLFHWVEARGEYRHTSVQIAFMTWAEQQAKIDQLKAELALCREENKGLVGKVSEQRQINKTQLNKLINKSVRLTDAEFEYKRIKGLQAKDCLQIMRLTARNEKLNNELKTVRGVDDINLTR